MLKLLIVSIRLSNLFLTEFKFKWLTVFLAGYPRRCVFIFKRLISSNLLFKERELERVLVLPCRFRLLKFIK